MKYRDKYGNFHDSKWDVLLVNYNLIPNKNDNLIKDIASKINITPIEVPNEFSNSTGLEDNEIIITEDKNPIIYDSGLDNKEIQEEKKEDNRLTAGLLDNININVSLQSNDVGSLLNDTNTSSVIQNILNNTTSDLLKDINPLIKKIGLNFILILFNKLFKRK